MARQRTRKAGTVSDDSVSQRAQSWTTLQALVVIGGLCTSAFVAGISYGAVSTVSEDFKVFVQESKNNYVRKDGAELQAIRGTLTNLESKVDLLLRQRMGTAEASR